MLSSQREYRSICGMPFASLMPGLVILLIVLTTGCATGHSRTLSVPSNRQSNVPNILPVDYSKVAITSAFGRMRTNPDTHKTYGHKGVDLCAPKGVPVLATANGIVAESTESPSYGKLIRLDHRNGIETLYAHLSARYVNGGARVKQGQQIGAVGATGRATGNHLHYEVRVNGAPVNPLAYMPRVPDAEDVAPRKVYTDRR